MSNINLGKTIAALRKERAMTQEQLAQELGVSAQAVSKWENDLSLPDVSLLVPLAELFEISLDELFSRPCPAHAQDEEQDAEQIVYHELPWDDDPATLHAVLFAGHRLIGRSLFQRHQREKQKIEFCYEGPALNIQSDFSVVCHEGTTIQGAVTAGDGVTCGNVSGSVNAGDGVVCGSVGGNVIAGDDVRCGNVGGNVFAGDDVKCGNVSGDIKVSDRVQCADGVHMHIDL